MTTFRCPSDILFMSCWLFTTRRCTWPRNHLVPCVTEFVGSCVPIHACRGIPNPKCLFDPSGFVAVPPWRPLATPDQRLPSQPQGITAHLLVPNYTVWWQRHMCVNNLPRVALDSGEARIRNRDLGHRATQATGVDRGRGGQEGDGEGREWVYPQLQLIDSPFRPCYAPAP